MYKELVSAELTQRKGETLAHKEFCKKVKAAKEEFIPELLQWALKRMSSDVLSNPKLQMIQVYYSHGRNNWVIVYRIKKLFGHKDNCLELQGEPEGWNQTLISSEGIEIEAKDIHGVINF